MPTKPRRRTDYGRDALAITRVIAAVQLDHEAEPDWTKQIVDHLTAAMLLLSSRTAEQRKAARSSGLALPPLKAVGRGK